MVVGCPHVPVPGALDVERRPGELVCPGLPGAAVESEALTVRRGDDGIHGRGPDELVAELLAGGDVVLAEEGNGRRRRGHAEVLEQESVLDCPPAERVRPAEELPVERRRDRRARVDRRRGHRPEPGHRPRQLVDRDARAISGLVAVDRNEHDPPVRELTDARAGIALGEVARVEALTRVEDRLAVCDERRAAADRVRDARPVRRKDQPHGHVPVLRRVGLKRGKPAA